MKVPVSTDVDVPPTTGERVRARTWDEYVGQTTMKRRLHTHISSARSQDRNLDHMLLTGPPGAGKTTLADLIAQAIGDPFHSMMMPIALREFVYFCKEWVGGVLFLDEIHRAPRAFQESLLPAIEDGELRLTSGTSISVRHITFIGATTEPQLVIKPLWDRFLVKPRWEEYSDDEMGQIVAGMARRAGVPMAVEMAVGLARAAGGTPRTAGELVVAFRDLLITGQDTSVDAVLDQAGIDVDGLTDRHLEYLRTVSELGGITGVKNVCSLMQLPLSVVEELERLLIKRGFVRLESNGRSLTNAGLTKIPAVSSKPSQRQRRRRAS